jgi:hypothetical protein
LQPRQVTRSARAAPVKVEYDDGGEETASPKRPSPKPPASRKRAKAEEVVKSEADDAAQASRTPQRKPPPGRAHSPPADWPEVSGRSIRLRGDAVRALQTCRGERGLSNAHGDSPPGGRCCAASSACGLRAAWRRAPQWTRWVVTGVTKRPSARRRSASRCVMHPGPVLGAGLAGVRLGLAGPVGRSYVRGFAAAAHNLHLGALRRARC